MKKFDIIIVGAGIVGLGTAVNLLRQRPNLSIVILEKEDAIAKHQTGNNSGVIHSGIYYKPGSLKSKNCKLGYDKLLSFCKEYGIEHDVCGKVIVATKESQREALDNIYKRGVQNGLTGIRKITKEEVKDIEPHVQSVEAIWVPQAGIVDYKDVAKKYQELVEEKGGAFFFNHKVVSIKKTTEGILVTTPDHEFTGKLLLNCAGLYSDKVAKMTQPEIDLKVIPFRGEYYELVEEKEYLVNNLIYPVPNPEFPFLGVHFTRMIKGGIEAGPNAVLAFRREGYKKSDFNLGEFAETLTYSGFRKIAMRYWRDGLGEMYRSFSKAAFTRALQELMPEIKAEDLKPGGAGVRAQTCDSKGNLSDDFIIYEDEKIVNVCNAPSPAATSSLAIGETLSNKILNQF